MNPAPAFTTQSKGLLLGSPEGNEQTFSRSRLDAPASPCMARSIEHVAFTSAPSSPRPGNASPTMATVQVVVRTFETTVTCLAQRSDFASLQMYTSATPAPGT